MPPANDIRAVDRGARSFGLYLVVIGAISFLCLSGFALRNGPTRLLDFKTAYYSARTLLEHGDPYSPDDLLRTYNQTQLPQMSVADPDSFALTRNVYFPTEFAVTVPLSLLPFSLAQAIWVGLTAAIFILAAFLMWDLASVYAPEAAGALLCFLLATSEQILLYGNPVGLALGLVAVAAWCFIRGRFIPIGIAFLAASLALKPHDAGLIWVYFILAGRPQRRHALMAMAVVVAISLPIVFWLSHVAPNWAHSMNANWATFTARGQAADPGPTAFINHGTAPITSLDCVFSLFRDDPSFYKTATWLVCAPLLLVWMSIALRTTRGTNTTLLALATAAPLSMLPVYHRVYDAKLLMLAVPACALLWSHHRRVGQIALALTAIGVVLTGDLTWSTYVHVLAQLHPVNSPQTAATALALPLPLSLLALSVFYLYISSMWTRKPSEIDTSSSHNTTIPTGG